MGFNPQGSTRDSIKDVIRYYLDTGLDYGEWSPEYNMHFGFFKWGMNPFRRERMLDEMNQQVFTHLQLSPEDKVVYDLGCGLGAPCRSFARRFQDKKIIGVTIVPWQVDKAKLLNEEAGLDTGIEMVLGDYTNLPFDDNSVDGVFALESCCHCEGLDKAAFIKEMMRVLKPGKHFVIVDGFIKKDPKTFRFILRYCYQQIIKGWALPSFPNIDLLCEAIRNEGGENIAVKDFSFRVAPSVMHSPFTVLYFLIKKTLQGEKLNPVRLGHLKACLLGLVLGMHRGKFAYCMITGVKQEPKALKTQE